MRTGSFRAAIEAIDPATYLASSSDERWARAVEALVVAGGSLARAEIDDRAAAGGPEPVRSTATDPALVAGLRTVLDGPRDGPSGDAVAHAFAVGDRVTSTAWRRRATTAAPATCGA